LERNERNKGENGKEGNILWKGATVKKKGKRLEGRICMGQMMEKQENKEREHMKGRKKRKAKKVE
jgi:hypothetical protein